MPSFRTEVSHGLGKDQATQRLRSLLEKVAHQYQGQVSRLESAWDDNTLSFSLTTYGVDVSGTLTVEDDKARLEGKLPLAALPFKGRIEKSIATELQRELA